MSSPSRVEAAVAAVFSVCLIAVVAEDPADHALHRDAATEHCGDDQGGEPL